MGEKIVGCHTLYGVVLLAAAFVHGILAGNKPGMVTGKLAWMVLLILILLTLFRKKMKTRSWNRIHSGLAAVVCLWWSFISFTRLSFDRIVFAVPFVDRKRKI